MEQLKTVERTVSGIDPDCSFHEVFRVISTFGGANLQNGVHPPSLQDSGGDATCKPTFAGFTATRVWMVVRTANMRPRGDRLCLRLENEPPESFQPRMVAGARRRHVVEVVCPRVVFPDRDQVVGVQMRRAVAAQEPSDGAAVLVAGSCLRRDGPPAGRAV